jgi:Xaa-Pro dipeptidase
MSRTITSRTTGVLEDGAGVDFTSLRASRRARVLAAMERDGVDILMLGRTDNARYVAGHRPIWRAVVTTWGPTVALVRATGEVHVMASTWDDGIPPEIEHDHITGLLWNPRLLMGAFTEITGLADATTLAVDGMSPGMAKALAFLAPNAAIVDGESMLREVRAIKEPAEVACIQTAIALTEGALTSARADLQPGVREIDLKAIFLEAMGDYGVNHSAMEGTFCATPRDGDPAAPPLRQIPTDRPVGVGDLVAMSASIPFAGYEGAVGRTWAGLGPTGSVTDEMLAVADRWLNAINAVIDACRVGAPVRGLTDAWVATGEPSTALPLAFGVGVGVEHLDEDDTLREDMVIAVQGYVWEPGVGGYLGVETVLIGADGPEVLTRLSREP